MTEVKYRKDVNFVIYLHYHEFMGGILIRQQIDKNW